jgi:hypothetical protein
MEYIPSIRIHIQMCIHILQQLFLNTNENKHMNIEKGGDSILEPVLGWPSEKESKTTMIPKIWYNH